MADGSPLLEHLEGYTRDMPNINSRGICVLTADVDGDGLEDVIEYGPEWDGEEANMLFSVSYTPEINCRVLYDREPGEDVDYIICLTKFGRGMELVYGGTERRRSRSIPGSGQKARFLFADRPGHGRMPGTDTGGEGRSASCTITLD